MYLREKTIGERTDYWHEAPAALQRAGSNIYQPIAVLDNAVCVCVWSHRDAAMGECSFPLTVLDCLHGIHKVSHNQRCVEPL